MQFKKGVSCIFVPMLTVVSIAIVVLAGCSPDREEDGGPALRFEIVAEFGVEEARSEEEEPYHRSVEPGYTSREDGV